MRIRLSSGALKYAVAVMALAVAFTAGGMRVLAQSIAPALLWERDIPADGFPKEAWDVSLSGTTLTVGGRHHDPALSDYHMIGYATYLANLDANDGTTLSLSAFPISGDRGYVCGGVLNDGSNIYAGGQRYTQYEVSRLQLRKCDASGNDLVVKEWGPPFGYSCYLGIASVARNGSVLLAAGSSEYQPFGSAAWYALCNSDTLEEIATGSYGPLSGPGWTIIKRCVAEPGGTGFYVAGFIGGIDYAPYTLQRGFVAKIGADGATHWFKEVFAPGGFEQSFEAICVRDNMIYVTGNRYAEVPGVTSDYHSEVLVVKIEDKGDSAEVLSERVVVAPAFRRNACGITKTADGVAVVAFCLNDANPNADSKWFMAGFDTDLNPRWELEVGTPGRDFMPRSITSDPAGNRLFVAGTSAPTSTSKWYPADTIVVKAYNLVPLPETLTMYNVSVTSPTVEMTSATLTGNIADPDPFSSYLLEVNWGDDPTSEVVSLEMGATSFTLEHLYRDDDPSYTPEDVYPINLLLVQEVVASVKSDAPITIPEGAFYDTTQTETLVTDVAPILTSAEATTVDLGDFTELRGSFVDPADDFFYVDVDWGDGTTETVFVDWMGMRSILASHKYAQKGTFTITATLVDDDTLSDTVTVLATVNNRVPVLHDVGIRTPINEGEGIWVSGGITDSPDEEFTVTINWADGSTPQTITLPAGSTTFYVTHVYGDDNPTGTPFDDYNVQVVASDGESNSLPVFLKLWVNNMPPMIEGVRPIVTLDQTRTAAISGTIADFPSDTFTVWIDWGDGSTPDQAPSDGSFSLAHTYANVPSGGFEATLRVTDDDTMVDVETIAIVENTAPSLPYLFAFTPIREGEMTTLTGIIRDTWAPGPLIVTIDWRDGSAPEVLNLPVANMWDARGRFEVAHLYVDDDPTSTPSDVYIVRVVTSDGLVSSEPVEYPIQVDNIAPGINSLSYVPPVNEGDEVTISGNSFDPGVADILTVRIDWGDGSAPSEMETTGPFSLSHVYVDDDPSNTESDIYTAVVTVTDDDGGSTGGLVEVSVSNVAPVLADVPAGLQVNEAGVATISGNIIDPGVSDSFTVSVEWGDGSAPSDVPSSGSFTLTHVYADDDPSGTSSDTYAATITVTDDDGGSDSEEVSVQVDNLPPTISGLLATSSVDGLTTLTGMIQDASVLDTFTITVDWGDGTTSETFNQPAGQANFSLNHTYATPGNYTVSVSVTDDDTGVASGSTQVIVAAGEGVDLVVNKWVGSAKESCNITFAVNVVNAGATTATNVMLVDRLPAGVSELSTLSHDCTREGEQLVCSLGDMEPGALQAVVIVGIPNGTDPVTNEVNVSSNEPDLNAADNTASVTAQVEPLGAGADILGQFNPEKTSIKCRQRQGGIVCKIKAAATATNRGTEEMKSTARLYLSTDKVLSNDDIPVGSKTFKVKAGKIKSVKVQGTTPAGTQTSGRYLIVMFDDSNVVSEACELNNCSMFGPLQ